MARSIAKGEIDLEVEDQMDFLTPEIEDRQLPRRWRN
jgi:hypothetical protein